DGVRKKIKVAWRFVNLPKKEGGLGVRALSTWNQACIIRHLWNILMQSGSLWITWILHYRVKSGTIWDCPSSPYLPWVWRKILKTRGVARRHLDVGSDGSVRWQGSPMLKFLSQWYDTLLG
ncbi:hypothetical protein LINGRAHAP2_LOCUS22775, partial [Linum grandiflorum]